MTAALTMSGWFLAGAAATRTTAPTGAPWWRWLPIAAVFGPMWFFVTADQRREDLVEPLSDNI